MNLSEQILANLLKNKDLQKIIETESIKALQKIKTIIEDNSLTDFECIEEIVCVFESIGSDGGDRHDF